MSDYLDRLETGWREQSDWNRAKQFRALVAFAREVQAIHVRDEEEDVCDVCTGQFAEFRATWPCPTARALDRLAEGQP